MNNEIKKLIRESQKLSNDSRRENKLVMLLRKEDQSEVSKIIRQMVEKRSTNAISIAKRTLTEKKIVRDFFWYGLDFADAHTIQFWLDFALPKLGTRSVVAILKKKGLQLPELMDKALYFLPSLVRKEEYALVNELKEYRDTLKKQHVWKKD